MTLENVPLSFLLPLISQAGHHSVAITIRFDEKRAGQSDNQ